MSWSTHTGAAKAPAQSLRSHWTRAFAGLVVVLVVGGIVSAIGTHELVSNYRATAHRVEQEAGDLASLRAEIVDDVIATSVVTPTVAQLTSRTSLQTNIRQRFTHNSATFHTANSRQLLGQSFQRWTAMHHTIDSLRPVGSATQYAVLVGTILTTEAPKILAAIDGAGQTGRAAARQEQARNAMLQRALYLGLFVTALIELLLMARLVRRLLLEVLKPVSRLRSTADLLAAGDLTQRAEVARDDEIGDLARSFNAMADAIAGSQQTLTRQANQDPLTGLENRAGFSTRVQKLLADPERRNGRQAILFVDLDDFKNVNDLLGHAAGDELLCVVATRLREMVRPEDIVARLGGDEFALLLDGLPDEAAAYSLASRAVTVIAQPVQIMGHPVHVGASIGMSMLADGSGLDALMREADVAMYSAKGKGKNRVERYDASLNHAVAEHHALRADVDGAAERDELVLDYQPIIDLSSGELLGVEALVRWQHPTRGLLPPSAFIELAEEVGAITAIGTWVLRTAAEQMHGWQRRHSLPRLWLSVNVSVRQLEAPDFAELVMDVLGSTGLDPCSLVLEVTESVLADPRGGASEALADLRRLGIRVALDDFGTGFCSIGYLRQLPVDILKIDRSFVSGPDVDGRVRPLLEAIVALGHQLGLDVLPEGIERPEDLAVVQALGCSSGQGFLLSRPIPAQSIDEWLTARSPLALDLYQANGVGSAVTVRHLGAE